jgi:hypothetical protein
MMTSGRRTIDGNGRRKFFHNQYFKRVSQGEDFLLYLGKSLDCSSDMVSVVSDLAWEVEC